MIATTRAVVLRGVTVEDALGDEVEDNSAAAIVGRTDGYPVSLIEQRPTVLDPTTGEWRTVQKIVGRFAGDVDVDEGDRVKDLRDGAIYAVDEVERMPRGLSGRSSVTLRLRRTAP
jgi:hypothetical protein